MSGEQYLQEFDTDPAPPEHARNMVEEFNQQRREEFILVPRHPTGDILG